METRFAISPIEEKQFTTEQLRQHFLVDQLMQDDAVKLVYTHYDRVIIGGIKPISKTITLPNHPELRAEYFLERRELGIINVGGSGIVKADGKEFAIDKLDCVYLGKGTKDVKFKSISKTQPSIFYFLSSPGHHTYPNRLMKKEKSNTCSAWCC